MGTGRTRRAGLPARGIRYVLAEGLQGFRRNGLMSVAAVTITTVALVALGAVLVVVGTLDHAARVLEQQLHVVVYLRDGLPAEEVQGLRDRLTRLPGVTGVTYVTKDEALARLQQMFGARVEMQDLVARNPLPDSLVVTADRPARLGPLADAARKFPEVEEARYGEQVADRLIGVTGFVRVGGTVATGVLALVALIIITSTIRLTVFARRAEIEVMRLVGATAGFIRWPFIVEGATTGACGALAAFLLVAGAYAALALRTQAVPTFLPLPAPEQVALAVLWKLLLWGVLLGILGSLLAVRRYLRI